MGKLSSLVHARARPWVRKKRTERIAWLGNPDASARVGGLIRDLRIDAELSVAELAKRMDLPRPVVSRDELRPARSRGFELRLLNRYAEALGFELEVLLVAVDQEWCAGALREEARLAKQEELQRAALREGRRRRGRAFVRRRAEPGDA